MNKIKKILYLIILSIIIIFLYQIEGYSIGANFSGWYPLPGLTIGKTDRDDIIIGGEFSIVYLKLRPIIFSGFYMDIIYEVPQNSGRISCGPEFGLMYFGVDGGLAVQYDNKKINYGYTIRPFISLASLTWRLFELERLNIIPYFRYTNIQDQKPIKELGAC